MSSWFLEGLQVFFHHASSENDTKFVPCVEKIDHYKFYQFSLIPAVLMCCLFGATKTRRQILLDKFGGRPGLVYPMDTMTRAHSFSYSCAFGVTVSVVYQILDEQKFAIQYSGPVSLGTLIAVVSMFIYGIVFFPVFASLALGTVVSYGCGTAYVWMFFIIEIYKLTECQVDAKGRIVWIIRDVPNLFCLTYLGVTLPMRCYNAFRKKHYFTSIKDVTKVETLEKIRYSYQGIHVRELLRKPIRKPSPPPGKMNRVKTVVKSIVQRYIYQRKRGFEFPSRLVSVMFVAGSVIYMASVELLVFFVQFFNMIIAAFASQLDFLKWEEQPRDTSATKFLREAYVFWWYACYVIKVCVVVAIIMAGLMSLLIILHMMTSYRKNLFALYRGDFRNIPPAESGSAISLCVGSMKFAGYQVAYLFWSFILSCLVLFLIAAILALVIILIIAGYTDWLVTVLREGWPAVFMAVAVYVAHYCVARFFFLQGTGKYLRLNNRRFYFVFTYFVFFFNIFMGLASCLMRILKAIGVGVVFLARLDNSTLPRAFEFFDPGFSAYRGYIHMEAAHTHPVVHVFVRILMSMAKNKKNVVRVDNTHIPRAGQAYLKLHPPGAPGHQNNVKVRESAKFKWLMTYTLLANPTIRIYRKGYIQALRKAREEGIKIPISDKLFTEFDLVKSKEEREREKNAELKTIRAAVIDGQAMCANLLITVDQDVCETVIF